MRLQPASSFGMTIGWHMAHTMLLEILLLAFLGGATGSTIPSSLIVV